MTARLAVVAATRRKSSASSITISADWGLVVGGALISSADRTVTVPGGNPGNLQLSFYINTGAPTIQYKKNAAYTNLTTPATVNFATSDTLGFRAACSSGDSGGVEVTDSTTGALVGGFQFSRP